MENGVKTKKQLIGDLHALRQQIAKLRELKANRNKAQPSLVDFELRYRRLFESAQDGILILDGATGQIIDVNPFLVNMLGYPKEEFLGKNLWEIGPFKDIETSKTAYLELQKKDYIRYEHLPLETKDKRQISVEFVSNAYTVDHVRVIQCNIRDATERKQAENELVKYREPLEKLLKQRTAQLKTVNALLQQELTEHKQTVRLFTDLLNCSPSGIYVIQDGKFELVNAQFQKVTGYDERELLQMDPLDITLAKERDTIKKNVTNMLKGRRISPYEYRFVNKRGKIKWATGSVNSIQYKGKRATLGSFLDVTARKKADVEKQELERKAQLASRLASIGEMASGIAHEINNPLTAVIGYAQLLMRKEIPEDIKEAVQTINEGAQRVANIVQRLLTFARQHKPTQTYVNINEIIEKAIALQAYGLATNNIKTTTRLDPDLPMTMADAHQLQQVFLNIIVNAETAMRLAHGKGKFFIKTEKVSNTIRISVKDDGPGITKKNVPRIFDPFFTTREIGKGTGLGLSICYGIINEHNGHIFAKSKLGKGATFVVELPIVTEPKQLELTKPVVEETLIISRARILVVDDEPSILKFLNRVLTDEGHEVATINDAAAALEMVKSQRYSLILLDIKMPGMSGIEFYKHIHKIAPSLAKRVVFITGDVMSPDTAAFLNNTKAHHITKPFEIEQLKEEVNYILTRGIRG